MKSHAIGHFPHIRFTGGRKQLLNPVLKQRFANRPEERVRLQYVEYLLRDTDIRPGRIGFEAPVSSAGSDHALRADLVIYDRSLEPYCLIECKSEKIKLTEKTALQAARYNISLEADYVMITNGLTDFWYRVSGGTVVPLDAPPFPQRTGPDPKKVFDYWHQRGFLSASLPEAYRRSASRFLSHYFSGNQPNGTIRYLHPPEELTGFPSDHYYLVSSHEKAVSLAFTLFSSATGDTLFSVLLNREGKLSGLFHFNLCEINDDREMNHGLMITPSGNREKALPDFIRRAFTQWQPQEPGTFENRLINFFD